MEDYEDEDYELSDDSVIGSVYHSNVMVERLLKAYEYIKSIDLSSITREQETKFFDLYNEHENIRGKSNSYNCGSDYLQKIDVASEMSKLFTLASGLQARYAIIKTGEIIEKTSYSGYDEYTEYEELCFEGVLLNEMVDNTKKISSNEVKRLNKENKFIINKTTFNPVKSYNPKDINKNLQLNDFKIFSIFTFPPKLKLEAPNTLEANASELDFLLWKIKNRCNKEEKALANMYQEFSVVFKNFKQAYINMLKDRLLLEINMQYNWQSSQCSGVIEIRKDEYEAAYKKYLITNKMLSAEILKINANIDKFNKNEIKQTTNNIEDVNQK